VDEKSILGRRPQPSGHCSHPAAFWANSRYHWRVPTNALSNLSDQRVLYFPYCSCRTSHHLVKSRADYLPPGSCHCLTEKSHTHDLSPRKTGANRPAYHDLQKIFKQKKKNTKKSTQVKYIFSHPESHRQRKTNTENLRTRKPY